MFKSVTLLESHRNGKHSWRLLDPEGRPIPAFDVFAKTLERQSINTRKSYLRWLAEFFDFIFEAAASSPASEAVSHDDLVAIIEAYDDYLVLGGDSGNPIAQRVNRSTPSPRISKASSATKHAAIRRFLKLSERLRKQILELTNNGLMSGSASEHSLIPGLGERRTLTALERQHMVRNSLIAACVSKGPQLIEDVALPSFTSEILYKHERAFPFDRVGDVLSHMKTYRDKALYALCAASGCRISEALQLLWDDINTVEQTVRLVDPKTRPHHHSYLTLLPIERDKLVWKGRSNPMTLLIEPFSSMFFKSLASYLRHEYIPHGKHNFIFQYTHRGRAGHPYFLASASSRNGVLSRAIKQSGLIGVEGAHSFRHMYGTYLLNYFPRPDGTYGLPLGIVQKLLNHKQIKDTEKYAQYDKDLYEAELNYANMMVYKNGDTTSLNELKRNALLKKLLDLESELGNVSQN